MASTTWKGYITFGLISVPVRLFTAARSDRVSFNQLHKECHTHVRQQLYCPTCDAKVERSDLVKGYQDGKDQYILVEDAEIKKVQPASAAGMEILEFVRLDEVDPLYLDSSFYALPDDAGRKAYFLLADTMQQSGYAAIAKLSMHQREYTVLLRARAGGLTLHTMYYPNEIRRLEEYGRDTDLEVKPQEAELARQLIESLAAPFEPAKYSDGYQQRLKELIDAKREGKDTAPTAGPKLAPVIDLMEALQKSLKGGPNERGPARATEADASDHKQRTARKSARQAG